MPGDLGHDKGQGVAIGKCVVDTTGFRAKQLSERANINNDQKWDLALTLQFNRQFGTVDGR